MMCSSLKQPKLVLQYMHLPTGGNILGIVLVISVQRETRDYSGLTAGTTPLILSAFH